MNIGSFLNIAFLAPERKGKENWEVHLTLEGTGEQVAKSVLAVSRLFRSVLGPEQGLA